MNREQIKKQLLKFFRKLELPIEPNTHQDAVLIDGEWYAPDFGCDTLQWFLDEFIVEDEKQEPAKDAAKDWPPEARKAMKERLLRLTEEEL